MGLRFYNFNNPIYKSYLFLYTNTSRHKSLHQPLTFLIQSLNSHFNHDPFNSNPRRSHFGHSHDHHDHHQRQQLSGTEGDNIFKLGLGADIGLAAAKALTGYLSGSTAIIADAAHSASDVVLSGVALWSFRAGKVPKDKEHPYGHGKFESLGALGISGMLLVTAGGIAWHAVDLLLGLLSATPNIGIHEHTHVHSGGHHHGIDMAHPTLALGMALVSISVKEGLYWITKRAGERQGSGLMKANAWHHRADAISSVVALIGVGGSIIGVKFLDPFAGLVVSAMIFKAGLEAGYQSVLELVDAAVPLVQFDPIKQTILQVKGVKGCHRLRGRRAGSYLHLDVHIEVDPFLSVSAAHEIGENVRQEIHKSHPEIAEVYIHIDPAYLFPTKKVEQEKLENTMNMDRNLKYKNIERFVSNFLLSEFAEKMEVERVVQHLLQGKIFLEIGVSMPPNILIRDAMRIAEAAEKEITKADPDIVQVSFQLRLGRMVPKFENWKHKTESTDS